MGDAMKADGAFIGQDVLVTPLIGKLRLHIQGYVDKEDFFISPPKDEDVILGAPWFDCMVASIKFPKRRVSFKFKEKDMYIVAQELGNTTPLVHTQAFDFSIKSSIFAYMTFVEDSLSGVNYAQLELRPAFGAHPSGSNTSRQWLRETEGLLECKAGYGLENLRQSISAG
ncbi:hypothetical protein L7F22_057093 [Adiantum nelumboides]|nr:hypothetical protein [Adiantum nelumboides]